MNGVFQSLSLNMIGPFASLFARRLNASDYEIGLLNSYPGLFCIFAMFLGTFLFRKYKNKERVTTLFFVLGRFFFLVFIFIPLLPAYLQPGLFVLLYGFMNFPNAIPNMGWQSYLGDLFSDVWRGRAFSRRSSLSLIAALVVTLVGGNLLFFIPKNEPQRIHMYQYFFVISLLFGIIEIYYFTRHKLDKSNTQVETITELSDEPLVKRLKVISGMLWSNKAFVIFCLCAVFFQFGWVIGWPLFFTYEMDILHSNESLASFSSTFACLIQAFAFPVWQKLCERKGNTFIIIICAFLLALTPLFYLVAKNMYYIIAFQTVSATATAGITLLLMNNLFEVCPDKNRTTYIGVYTVLLNIAIVIAPIIGMNIKQIFNLRDALVVVAILRTLSGIAFVLRYRLSK
jgi:Na+/melibiose symporter-like transporter